MTRLFCRSKPVDWNRLPAGGIPRAHQRLQPPQLGCFFPLGPWSVLIISNRSGVIGVAMAARRSRIQPIARSASGTF